MNTIHKFRLPDVISGVEMPRGAEILDIQRQGSYITLWAMVNTDLPKIRRMFQIVGTGHDIPAEPHRYLRTVQMGQFVWHIFELGE